METGVRFLPATMAVDVATSSNPGTCVSVSNAGLGNAVGVVAVPPASPAFFIEEAYAVSEARRRTLEEQLQEQAEQLQVQRLEFEKALAAQREVSAARAVRIAELERLVEGGAASAPVPHPVPATASSPPRGGVSSTGLAGSAAAVSTPTVALERRLLDSEDQDAAKAAQLQAELEAVQAQLAHAKDSAVAIEARLAELIEARSGVVVSQAADCVSTQAAEAPAEADVAVERQGAVAVQQRFRPVTGAVVVDPVGDSHSSGTMFPRPRVDRFSSAPASFCTAAEPHVAVATGVGNGTGNCSEAPLTARSDRPLAAMVGAPSPATPVAPAVSSTAVPVHVTTVRTTPQRVVSHSPPAPVSWPASVRGEQRQPQIMQEQPQPVQMQHLRPQMQQQQLHESQREPQLKPLQPLQPRAWGGAALRSSSFDKDAASSAAATVRGLRQHTADGNASGVASWPSTPSSVPNGVGQSSMAASVVVGSSASFGGHPLVRSVTAPQHIGGGKGRRHSTNPGTDVATVQRALLEASASSTASAAVVAALASPSGAPGCGVAGDCFGAAASAIQRQRSSVIPGEAGCSQLEQTWRGAVHRVSKAAPPVVVPPGPAVVATSSCAGGCADAVQRQASNGPLDMSRRSPGHAPPPIGSPPVSVVVATVSSMGGDPCLSSNGAHRQASAFLPSELAARSSFGGTSGTSVGGSSLRGPSAPPESSRVKQAAVPRGASSTSASTASHLAMAPWRTTQPAGTGAACATVALHGSATFDANSFGNTTSSGGAWMAPQLSRVPNVLTPAAGSDFTQTKRFSTAGCGTSSGGCTPAPVQCVPSVGAYVGAGQGTTRRPTNAAFQGPLFAPGPCGGGGDAASHGVHQRAAPGYAAVRLRSA